MPFGSFPIQCLLYSVFSAINSVPKSTVYKNKYGRYRFFENGKTKTGQTILRWVYTLVWMCKSWLKVLKTWIPNVWNTGYPGLCSCKEVANKSGGRYLSRTLYCIGCGLNRFLVEKYGDGALNPLAISGKRYHFDWIWKILLFVVCIWAVAPSITIMFKSLQVLGAVTTYELPMQLLCSVLHSMREINFCC